MSTQPMEVSTPCIHGCSDYRNCIKCQRTLASQQAQMYRRKRRARTIGHHPAGTALPSPAPVVPPRPETIAAARAAAAAGVQAAQHMRESQRRAQTARDSDRRRAVIQDAMRKLRQSRRQS